jgi:peptidoglycan/LPS O-acetylase OafA/YrhL
MAINSNPLRARSGHYLALDGLRGIAALAVVTYHVCAYFSLRMQPGHAYLAVDFFFMLSGFVISHAYDERLSRGMGGLAFLKLRLLRLYPMVLLGVGIGTVAFLAWAASKGVNADGAILHAAAWNALLLPTPALAGLSRWAFPLDTPLWSLAFELWINLIYAFGFVLLARRRLVLACGLGAVLLGATAVTHGGLNVGYAWSDFYLGGARVLFPFMFGVLLCRSLAGHRARYRGAHLVAIALIALMIAPVAWGAWFDIAAVLVGFPLIVTVGSMAAPNRRLDPLWRWLGAISYPLYTIHYPFVVVFSNLIKMQHLQAYAPLAALGTILFVVLAASAAAFWYDEPVRAWLKRRLRRPQTVSHRRLHAEPAQKYRHPHP